MTNRLTHRLARPDDIAVLKPLMDRAIGELLKPFLSPQAVAASFSVMGLDTQLIADGTYFVVESDGAIAGCGGWSRRATLFGGDHSTGRDMACSTRKRTPHGCAPCTPTRPSRGAALEDSCWRFARTQRRAKASSVSNWPPPWPACRFIAPAAMAESKPSKPTRRQACACR